MSVTYLMADGSTKKFTLNDEQKQQVLQMTGMSGIFGNSISTMFASAKKNRGGAVSDAVYGSKLDGPEAETDDMLVKVDRNKSNNEYAYVEFHDKHAKDFDAIFQKKLDEAGRSKAVSPRAKKMKSQFIDSMNKDKEKMRKGTMVKRVEKINRMSGITEEQDFFNNKDERIGWMRTKNKTKVRFAKHKRSRNSKNAPIMEPTGETGDIDMPVESEGEMQGVAGSNKFRTKVTSIKLNEPVEFKWNAVGKNGNEEKK